jgi:hypothetical protein
MTYIQLPTVILSRLIRALRLANPIIACAETRIKRIPA